MVDVKELRVGNWVKLNRSGIHFQVKAVDESYSEGECSAIPLTPEILEKCGFERDGEYYVTERVVAFRDMEVGFRHGYYEQIGTGFPHIKHLHQLQNLYFALTGTELNYKP